MNLKLRDFVVGLLLAAERLTRAVLSFALIFFWGRYVTVPCLFLCLYIVDPIAAMTLAVVFGATVITNGGKAVIITLIIQSSSAEPSYIHWGTGAGTAAAADTTLFTASSDESRTAGSSSVQTTTVANDTYRVTGTITCASSGKTVTNSGTFNDPSAGTLVLKGDYTGVALNVGDGISHTFNLKQA